MADPFRITGEEAKAFSKEAREAINKPLTPEEEADMCAGLSVFKPSPRVNHPDVVEALRKALAELSAKSDEELAEIFNNSRGDVYDWFMEMGEWPFNDPEAMASISRGLDQSKRGETSYLGSFAKDAIVGLELVAE